MDKTFIKTSRGIIRADSIVFVESDEETIRIYTDCNNRRIILQGKEAQSFLQIIPIAVDLGCLVKEEKSGIEIRG